MNSDSNAFTQYLQLRGKDSAAATGVLDTLNSRAADALAAIASHPDSDIFAPDYFAAVAVEYYGFFAFLNELLVEHIEHFEEAAACRNVVEVVVDELSFLLGTTLTPNFQIYADCIFHYYM